MSFDLNIEGCRALVTGGTAGVGAAVVNVLHELGATANGHSRIMSGGQWNVA